MYECGVDPECCENTEPVKDTVDDDDASEDDHDTDNFWQNTVPIFGFTTTLIKTYYLYYFVIS